jgi:hypothetical protein
MDAPRDVFFDVNQVCYFVSPPPTGASRPRQHHASEQTYLQAAAMSHMGHDQTHAVQQNTRVPRSLGAPAAMGSLTSARDRECDGGDFIAGLGSAAACALAARAQQQPVIGYLQAPREERARLALPRLTTDCRRGRRPERGQDSTLILQSTGRLPSGVSWRPRGRADCRCFRPAPKPRRAVTRGGRP